jgi:hypothetical protein
VEGVKPSPEVIAEEPTLWQRVRAAIRRF